ncbi:MAG: hypothetical protein VYC55_08515 [Pseudomonadota bacterium]|jgi:hypothetical protein|nr:hypothetical protein [Pseudomonadota bacterium]
MKAFGINFNSVGEAIEFNGKRVPYRVSPNVLISELAKPLRGFHQKIHSELHSALNSISDVAMPTIQPSQKPLRVARAA